MAENWDKKILKKQENEKINDILFKNRSHLISKKRLFPFYHDKPIMSKIQNLFVCL